MILRDRDASAAASPDGTAVGGNGPLEERVYLLQDANFNVTAATDAAGQVVERYTYDPYGTRTVLNGAADADGAVAEWTPDADDTSDYALTQGHQGGRHMAGPYGGVGGGGQAIDFRFRTLMSGTGTWNRQDPAGYVDGTNMRQVYGTNPIRWTDPLGLYLGPATGGQPVGMPPPPGAGNVWVPQGSPDDRSSVWRPRDHSYVTRDRVTLRWDPDGYHWDLVVNDRSKGIKVKDRIGLDGNAIGGKVGIGPGQSTYSNTGKKYVAPWSGRIGAGLGILGGLGLADQALSGDFTNADPSEVLREIRLFNEGSGNEQWIKLALFEYIDELFAGTPDESRAVLKYYIQTREIRRGVEWTGEVRLSGGCVQYSNGQVACP